MLLPVNGRQDFDKLSSTVDPKDVRVAVTDCVRAAMQERFEELRTQNISSPLAQRRVEEEFL